MKIAGHFVVIYERININKDYTHNKINFTDKIKTSELKKVNSALSNVMARLVHNQHTEVFVSSFRDI